MGPNIVSQTNKPCPDCDHAGPHDVYKHMGYLEMVCSACGMQNPFNDEDDAHNCRRGNAEAGQVADCDACALDI